jgi:hypothetical protein
MGNCYWHGLRFANRFRGAEELDAVKSAPAIETSSTQHPH